MGYASVLLKKMQKAVYAPDLKRIEDYLIEHFAAFKLVGYALDGRRVDLLHAGNPMERDAVVEMMRAQLAYLHAAPVEVINPIELVDVDDEFDEEDII